MRRSVSESFQWMALTDVGRVRSENQDACAIFSTESAALVAVVADGMGGHKGGAIASQLTIAAFRDVLANSRDEADGETLGLAIEEANRRVYEKSADDPELQGMGTTVVGFLIHSDGRAWIAHVGDSRGYRMRGEAFEALTEDHSRVAELVRSGVLTEEEAESDPRRNEILRSVGVESTVIADVSEVSVLPDDRFILCSDGLTGPVGEHVISSVLVGNEPEIAARTLIERANEAGGPDNIAVIVLHYSNSDDVTDVLGVPTPTDVVVDDSQMRVAKRIGRARRLLVWTAAVGVALLVSLILLLLSYSSTRTEIP